MLKPQNNFVVQLEGRHPGHKTHYFVAPPTALLDLAAKLEHLARAPVGARFDALVCERGNPNARVSMAFAQCTAEQLVQLQTMSTRLRRKRALSLAFTVVRAIFTVVGVITSVHYLLRLLA